MGAMGASAEQAFRDMQPLGLALTAVGAAGVAGLGQAVSMAADFESQVALMGVAAGDAGVGIGRLHDAALMVGGDISLVGVTASGAADSITNLLKAGLSIEDVFGDMNKYMAGTAELGGVLRASIDLAAASELDMAAASKVVSVAMSTFGIDADEATSITDNFVQSADASVASVGELADALINVGPTAASFGWGLEDVNTALAVLSQRGIAGAEAGTALKSMMTNIMRPTAKTTDALADLNVELYNQQGALKSLPQIMGELGAALSGVTEEQRNQYIQTLAGTYGMKAMNTLLAEGTEGWENMEGAIAGAATAAEIAQVKTNTLEGRIEALGGTVEAAGIAIGETFLDDLTGLTDWATGAVDAFNDLAPATKELVSNLLLIGTAGSLAFGGLILVVPKIAATVTALKALAAFTGLPGLLANIGLGFKMMGAGVSTATIASGGLGAIIGGIVAPLAALVGLVLLGNKILEGHEDTIFDLSDSYEQYERMARLAGDGQRMLTEAQWDAAKVPPPSPLAEIDTGQIDGLTNSQTQLGNASIHASSGMMLVHQGMSEIPGVATPAAEAMEPLATVMGSYAAYLADIDTSSGALWQLLVDTADAGGYTADEIERIGIATGTTTPTIIASGEAFSRLGGLMEAGIISADGIIGANLALAQSSGEHGAAAVKQAEYIMDVDEALFNVQEQATDLMGLQPLNLSIVSDGLDYASQKTGEILANMNDIPGHKSVTIDVRTNYSSTGAPSTFDWTVPEYAGGTPYVPDTGLAYLHQGEAVLPTDEAAAYRAGASGGTWNGNINIDGSGDPQATAAAVMQALQDRGIFSHAALR